MSHTFNGVALVVTATGTSVSTGAASANTTLPNNSNGSAPRFARFACTVACHVKIGASGLTATSNDLMIVPGSPTILAIPNGVTHFAYIQNGSAGTLNVAPLENA